jgi:hypothetical protein
MSVQQGVPELFSRKVFSNTSLAILDQVIYRLGTVAGFVLLVRLLPESAIAAVGIATGYLVLVKYLDIGLIRILYRDYPKIVSDRVVRDRHFSAYLLFLVAQTVAMMLVCLAAQALVMGKLGIEGLSFLFIGITIDFVALVVQDSIKLIYYTDLRQYYATGISFGLTLFRLMSYGALLLSPTLPAYTWLLIATGVAYCLVWGVAFHRSFHFHLVLHPDVLGVIRVAFAEYAFWDHMNRIAQETLLFVDTAVLSLFGRLGEIAAYTIALRFASLLTLLPQQLQRSLQVVLVNYSNESDRSDAIHTFLKLNAIICFVQMAVLVFGGRLIIGLLFGQNVEISRVYHYSLVLSAGVTVRSLANPMGGVVNSFCSLRSAFFQVFLPGTLLGGVLYTASAWFSGALMLAYAKLLVLMLLTVSLLVFARRQYPFALKFELVSPEEKKLLRRLLSDLKLRKERAVERFTSL